MILLTSLTHVSVSGCATKVGETEDGVMTAPICDFEEAPENIYHFKCVNNTNNYWEHDQETADPGPYINACVEVNPGEDDPTEGWRGTVKDACTAHCNYLAGQTSHVCDNANWSNVVPTPASIGEPCLWYVCPNETPFLNFDLIESVLGSQAAVDAEDLPCDLAFDCHGYLTLGAATALWTEPRAGVEQTAGTSVATVSGSQLYVIGAGQGTGTTEPLTGEAAFTATSCGGADACPFYLAQYELEGTSSNFNVTFALPGGGSLTKTISGLSIQLAQPALGMWLPNSGDVIFPTVSLEFRLSATLSGSPAPFGENGPYDDVYTVVGYVFGHWDPLTGEFALGANGENSFGEFIVSGVFEE